MKKTLISSSALLAMLACASPAMAHNHNYYYAVQAAACRSKSCAQQMLNKLPQHNRLRLLHAFSSHHAPTYKILDGEFTTAAAAKTVLTKHYQHQDAYVVRMTVTQDQDSEKKSTKTTIKSSHLTSTNKTAKHKSKITSKHKSKITSKHKPKITSKHQPKVASKHHKKITNSKLNSHKLSKTKISAKPVLAKPHSTAKIKKAPSFYVKQGSLQANLRRFAYKYHFHLLWKVVDIDSGLPADFNWQGSTRIDDAPLNILKQIVNPYNLQTNVWQSNHVICITNNNSCTN